MGGLHQVLYCSLCRKIKDIQVDHVDGGEWTVLERYLQRYQARPSDLVLSETFCPGCLVFYDQLMTYGKPSHPGLV
ncbi:MAG TPA: hypothetical protein VLA99_18130 [Nitrospiraceae bacterium]|nr:hypothetical protein [Nitrospiraceae bacterium]